MFNNTAKFGTSVVPAQPFTEINDVLPITAEIPSKRISTTMDGEILEVENVSFLISQILLSLLSIILI